MKGKDRLKRVMIFIGSYLPGTKSGGVTTSISNIVAKLSTYYEFYIVTADRDKGDIQPYKSVETECWTRYGYANVYYCQKYDSSIKKLREIINSVEVDVYYINGFYNRCDNLGVLLLHKLGKIARKPIIIAPRGIFSMGQYEKKRLARMAVRVLFRLCGFDKSVFWHSTSELEKNDILKHFPKVSERIYVVPNISGITIRESSVQPNKQRGSLKIVFVSRISEKKNIKFIVESLKCIRGNVECDLYGMIGTEDDKRYWAECQRLAEEIENKTVRVLYKGEVGHDKIPDIFAGYNLFFFPTFGENYGHVIAESLANGCPVMLSDTTPWIDLEVNHAGWVYPLSDKRAYVTKLQELIDMDDSHWRIYAEGALNYAASNIDETEKIDKHVRLFDDVS